MSNDGKKENDPKATEDFPEKQNDENPSEDSPLSFPCSFVIKVIGRSNTNFENIVLGILEEHCPDFDGHYQRRPSRDGGYIALTFTIQATSKAQLDAIYYDLSAHEKVVMAL